MFFLRIISILFLFFNTPLQASAIDEFIKVGKSPSGRFKIKSNKLLAVNEYDMLGLRIQEKRSSGREAKIDFYFIFSYYLEEGEKTFDFTTGDAYEANKTNMNFVFTMIGSESSGLVRLETDASSSIIDGRIKFQPPSNYCGRMTFSFTTKVANVLKTIIDPQGREIESSRVTETLRGKFKGSSRCEKSAQRIFNTN